MKDGNFSFFSLHSVTVMALRGGVGMNVSAILYSRTIVFCLHHDAPVIFENSLRKNRALATKYNVGGMHVRSKIFICRAFLTMFLKIISVF